MTSPELYGDFASNHGMINSERAKKYMPALVRIPELDELAREHAASMVRSNEL
jgi:uncharacterized protein YkwD